MIYRGYSPHRTTIKMLKLQSDLHSRTPPSTWVKQRKLTAIYWLRTVHGLSWCKNNWIMKSVCYIIHRMRNSIEFTRSARTKQEQTDAAFFWHHCNSCWHRWNEVQTTISQFLTIRSLKWSTNNYLSVSYTSFCMNDKKWQYKQWEPTDEDGTNIQASLDTMMSNVYYC